MLPKKILAAGTFDLLHPGHLYFLRQAKKLGDYLVVIVARDANVKKQKGYWPIEDERIRLAKLKKIKWIDRVVLGEPDLRKRGKILQQIKPQIIAQGYDQKIPPLKKYKTVKIKAFYPQKYKSSLLRKALQKK